MQIGYTVEDGRTELYTSAHPYFEFCDGYIEADVATVERYVGAILEVKKALAEVMPAIVADIKERNTEQL